MQTDCVTCGGIGWLCKRHPATQLNAEHDCALDDCTEQRRVACDCNLQRALPAHWFIDSDNEFPNEKVQPVLS